MKKYDYRVLMEDQVNGEKFNFALRINAVGDFTAEFDAKREFPEARVVEVKRVSA